MRRFFKAFCLCKGLLNNYDFQRTETNKQIKYKEVHKRELECKIKTIPTMIEEGKSEEEVLEYVYKICPICHKQKVNGE